MSFDEVIEISLGGVFLAHPVYLYNMNAKKLTSKFGRKIFIIKKVTGFLRKNSKKQINKAYSNSFKSARSGNNIAKV